MKYLDSPRAIRVTSVCHRSKALGELCGPWTKMTQYERRQTLRECQERRAGQELTP